MINAAKRWCTGADYADYIYCLVNSDPTAAKHEAMSFILIPSKSPGVSTSPIDHANLRYTASCDVHFDDVRLPLDAIVGGREKWGKGWQMLAGRALDVEKLEISAMTFGIAQAAVEKAWNCNSLIRVRIGIGLCYSIRPHFLLAGTGGLAKSAGAFDVPVPPRGYWAKLQNRGGPWSPRCALFLAHLPVPQPGGFGT